MYDYQVLGSLGFIIQEGGFSSSRTPLRLHVASDLLEAAGGWEFEFKGCVALGLFGLEASQSLANEFPCNARQSTGY